MKISKLLGIMFCGLIMGTGSKSHDVYICESCPEGTYSDTGEGCKPCPPGTYTDKMGSSECKTCPPGYYSDDWGSPSCTICPKGHYCMEGIKKVCANFSYSDVGANKCILGCKEYIYHGFDFCDPHKDDPFRKWNLETNIKNIPNDFDKHKCWTDKEGVDWQSDVGIIVNGVRYRVSSIKCSGVVCKIEADNIIYKTTKIGDNHGGHSEGGTYGSSLKLELNLLSKKARVCRIDVKHNAKSPEKCEDNSHIEGSITCKN